MSVLLSISVCCVVPIISVLSRLCSLDSPRPVLDSLSILLECDQHLLGPLLGIQADFLGLCITASPPVFRARSGGQAERFWIDVGVVVAIRLE